MKTRLLTSLLACILLLPLSACSFLGNCVEGEGEPITKEIKIDQFNKIELSSIGKVYLKQADEQKVTISAQENIIALLETKVKGDEWDIEFERCVKSEHPIEIYIESPEINEIEIEGSGEVISKGTLEGDMMELSIDGSGTINLDLNVKELNSEINGAGDLKLKGTTKLHDIEINGSGDIAAYDLKSDESDIEINGSGDVKVNVSYSLKVEINGSGDVYYKGEVKEIKSDINGSGKLHQKE